MLGRLVLTGFAYIARKMINWMASNLKNYANLVGRGTPSTLPTRASIGLCMGMHKHMSHAWEGVGKTPAAGLAYETLG